MEVENKSSRSDSFYSCLLYCVKVISPLKGAAVNLWEPIRNQLIFYGC